MIEYNRLQEIEEAKKWFGNMLYMASLGYNKCVCHESRKRIREAMTPILQKYGDVIGATEVSAGVADLFYKKGVDINELGTSWNNRNMLGQTEDKKSLLLFEHATPNRVMRDLILENREDTNKILEENYVVSWITREEDARLNEAGLRSSVPCGGTWQDRYAAANIEMAFFRLTYENNWNTYNI